MNWSVFARVEHAHHIGLSVGRRLRIIVGPGIGAAPGIGGGTRILARVFELARVVEGFAGGVGDGIQLWAPIVAEDDSRAIRR